ncbi:MAG: Na+/H+ antiporter NhaC family protein [Phycisphaerae bacterium]
MFQLMTRGRPTPCAPHLIMMIVAVLTGSAVAVDPVNLGDTVNLLENQEQQTTEGDQTPPAGEGEKAGDLLEEGTEAIRDAAEKAGNAVKEGLDRLTNDTAQTDPPGESKPGKGSPNQSTESTPSGTNTETATNQPAPPPVEARTGPATYGLWAIAPAIVAILLAIFTRQVVPALVVGLLVGAYMMAPYLTIPSIGDTGGNTVKGFRLAFEYYLLKAIYDQGSDEYGRLKIIVFTLIIGFMVGVIGRNGGTAGLVRVVTGESTSARRGTLTAWLAGMVVFFDDYANTMIVGPTMRPIFDKLKISRAKLAYIIDSTAAPVASIALIGTWVGAEIGYINDGIIEVKNAGREAMLTAANGSTYSAMDLFIRSLPYRFYPILALFFVFLVALLRRDFGPMRRAEAEAIDGTEERMDMDATTDAPPAPKVMLGLLPVLALVLVTVGVLVGTGLHATGGWAATADEGAWWQRAAKIVSKADAYLCIFYGAISSAILAVLLTIISRACSARDAVDAGLEGMGRMFPAIVILVLATAIQNVEGDLQLASAAGEFLRDAGFSAQYMPLAIFLASAAISFAMGSSWATMGLLCPLAVSVTVGLALNANMDAEAARVLLFSAVGSVLAGSIFGDHCSPISDTTVLSSIAAGCRHERHVWTQLPYALVTAIAAIGAGEVTCGIYGQPWYVGLGSGAAFLFLFLLIFGRSPRRLNGGDRTPSERKPLVSETVRSQVIAARMAKSAPPPPPQSLYDDSDDQA